MKSIEVISSVIMAVADYETDWGDSMSIKMKLILSNIALVVIPVLSIFVVDIILAFFIFFIFNNNADTFAVYRLATFIIVVIIVNLLLSLMLSRNIIKPVLKLNEHIKQIKEGNLEQKILIDRKDEIGELAESFESMRVSLKKAREKEQTYFINRQELMAGMSHDLKTPLTSIKGYVKGIEDGVADTPEKLERYTSVIQHSVSRLEHMIDDLFMYSKLDLEEIDFKFTKVNLERFLQDIVSEYTLDLTDSQQLYFTTEESNNHIVSADREQLYRALANVIDNAIKYSNPENTEINISLLEEDGFSIIEIHDNGIGIDEKDIDHIFDSFYRADQSRNSSTGGSGLGLSIVKRIIEKHCGEVSVDSKKNEGTIVIFNLKQVNEYE